MAAALTLVTGRIPAGSREEEIELASSAAAGNAASFESLVRRYNRLLFRAARGVVHDDAEAQDVVQETYLRVFTHLASFRGESSLGTWLARIAINVALSTLRKKGRLVSMDESENDPGDFRDEADGAPDGGISPSSIAEQKQIRALLQKSIGELPPIYRSVFILRAVEELSVAESAFCLSVSESVVKTRFLRARAMLREVLATSAEATAPDTFLFAGARCNAVFANSMAELLQRGYFPPLAPKDPP